MKKIFFLFSILFFALRLSAQTPDTAFVQAASNLYQPKANKAGVAISATAPLPLFQKADNKMKWIEENAAKNTVISISSTLFATGNTPYAGKFVRENGGSVITCFIDKTGVKYEINKKYLPSVGNSGVQVDANNPTSDFLGSFVKEEGKAYITAYVDAYGVRHSVSPSASGLQANTDIDSSTTHEIKALRFVAFGEGGVGSNSAFGAGALAKNTTGTFNATTGYNVLYNNTSGSYNTAIGANVLSVNTTGMQNTAVGAYSLAGNTTGIQNTGIGTYALFAATTTTGSTAVGSFSQYRATTGNNNTSLGYLSLYRNTVGTDNTVVGRNAMGGTGPSQFDMGSYNTAVGSSAFTGPWQSANIGNTAIGASSLGNTHGNYNTAIGYKSLSSTASYSTGSNTAIGYYSGFVLSSGANNTLIGERTGTTLTTGSNNVVIGQNVTVADITGNNQLVVGSGGSVWISGAAGKIAMPLIPIYADDVAADADTTLVSGSIYRISGGRALFWKP